MTTLAEAYINIKVNASLYELEAVQEYLSYLGNKHAHEIYDQEIDIQVRIEEGSLKTWVTVAGAIYVGISAYGSFRTGIDYLKNDGKAFGEAVSSTFIEEAGIEKQKVYRVERRLGTPGKIKRLLTKIDKLGNAEYSNQLVRDELKVIGNQVQNIVDDLDLKEDREMFVSNLPIDFRDVQLPEPKTPSADNESMSVIRPTLYSDYESDGTLSEFSKRIHKNLQLRYDHKK